MPRAIVRNSRTWTCPPYTSEPVVAREIARASDATGIDRRDEGNGAGADDTSSPALPMGHPQGGPLSGTVFPGPLRGNTRRTSTIKVLSGPVPG